MEWVIGEEHHGMLIRKYLQDVQAFSKRIITSVKFDGGQILVNGRRQTVRYRLSTDDILTIKFPPENKGYYMEPEDLPLVIMYEDDDVLIINKPFGMATIPSPHFPSGTVANGILAHYKKRNIPYTVHAVTRLDRDTSGLVLIAKHRYSHSLLAASQMTGKIKRKYKAIIEGHLPKNKGIINSRIGRKEGSIMERTVVKTGKKAITRYEVESKSQHHSLLDIELETGRTHQIRVHLSHIDHPIAGDDLYGGSTDEIGRHALHCYEISFEHPSTKERVSFHKPIPDDMRHLMLKRN